MKKTVKSKAPCTNASKTSQKPLQMPPRHPQDPPKATQDAPREAQNASKTPQEASKMPQVSPRTSPKLAKTASRGNQDAFQAR